MIRVGCTPPKKYNPTTKRCEPEDAEPTDGVAIGSMLSLDNLANGLALPAAAAFLRDNNDAASVVLRIMDRDGDGLLTASELVNTDILAIARRLNRRLPLPDTNLPGLGRNVRRLVDVFMVRLKCELAFGLGNERASSAPIATMTGDPARLLKIALPFEPPPAGEAPPRNLSVCATEPPANP